MGKTHLGWQETWGPRAGTRDLCHLTAHFTVAAANPQVSRVTASQNVKEQDQLKVRLSKSGDSGGNSGEKSKEKSEAKRKHSGEQSTERSEERAEAGKPGALCAVLRGVERAPV